MINLILFLILILELILSCTFFQIFTFFGSAPEIILITIVVYAMFFNENTVMIMALVIGFLMDLIYGQSLGLNMVVLGMIALIISRGVKSLNKESLWVSFLFFALAVIIYHVSFYLLLLFYQKAIPILSYLRQINFQYIIINIIFMFMLRYIILKMKQYPVFDSEGLR